MIERGIEGIVSGCPGSVAQGVTCSMFMRIFPKDKLDDVRKLDRVQEALDISESKSEYHIVSALK